MWPNGHVFIQGPHLSRLRYLKSREIAPLFSVANSKQEFQALLIAEGGVRGDVGGEKHAKNFCVFNVNLNGFRANRYEQMEI